jgi:hypothetical protein
VTLRTQQETICKRRGAEMWKFSVTGVATALFFGLIVSGYADDACQAVMLQSVPSTETGTIRGQGEHLNAVSIYRINRKTFADEFCEHGGDCYPAHVTAEGRRFETAKLLNCSIDPDNRSVGERYVVYGTELNRRSMTPIQLRTYDISDRLQALGFCDSCSSGLARVYVHHPRSRCATIIRSALEGSKPALSTLDRGACATVQKD